MYFEEYSRAVREADAPRPLSLPCGRCVGCRETRARGWAIRCMHEAQMHKTNTFVTLTYDDEHYRPGLDYSDFRWFMKRLRRQCGPTRFFMCGEYGEQNLRPHFHALLFGRGFMDLEPIGKNLWRSPTLEKIWTKGFSSAGEVNYDSARYVAGYCAKELKGNATPVAIDLTTGEYVRVRSEFGRMSTHPGIASSWWSKYGKETYEARDGVVINGKVRPTPRYYDKKLEELDWKKYEDKKTERFERSKLFRGDTTEARLRVREECTRARLKLKRKKI